MLIIIIYILAVIMSILGFILLVKERKRSLEINRRSTKSKTSGGGSAKSIEALDRMGHEEKSIIKRGRFWFSLGIAFTFLFTLFAFLYS